MKWLSQLGALLVLAFSSSCGGEGRVAQTAIAAKPAPTGAAGAAEWRRLTWRSERGEAQPEDWLRADAQLRSALAVKNLHLDRGFGQDGSLPSAASVAGIDPADWTFRGPNNVGGRVRSVLIDPRNANRLLAGSVSGGLWESLDAGATWQPIGDELPNFAVGSLAFDPLNPDSIYLGTGEGQFNADAIRGAGIFKSVDNGLSWSLLAATSGWASVNRIAISRQDPSRLLAATRYGGIQRSTDGGATWTVAASPGRRYGFDARVELAYARAQTVCGHPAC